MPVSIVVACEYLVILKLLADRIIDRDSPLATVSMRSLTPDTRGDMIDRRRLQFHTGARPQRSR